MTLKGLYAKEGRQNNVRITGRKKKGTPCTQGIQEPDQRLRRCDPDHESGAERPGNISRIKSSEGQNESFVSPLTLPQLLYIYKLNKIK